MEATKSNNQNLNVNSYIIHNIMMQMYVCPTCDPIILLCNYPDI